MDRGAWQATIHGNAKELDTTEQLNNTNNVHFSSVQALSRVRLHDPMDHSTPGLPVHHQLPSPLKLISIESVMPSNHLILCVC